MKRLLVLFPAFLLACNSQPASTQSKVDSTALANQIQPDITMSAKDFTAGAMGDNYFADQRLNKRIELTNVQFGGTENLGRNEINIWGNDGDVHWNGEYMCCRFIFKVSDPDQQKLIDAKGKYGTITGTLVEARDNESAPLGQTILLKEFVFENVSIEIASTTPAVATPEPAAIESDPPNVQQPTENVDAALVNTITGEVEKDERDSGIIVSDKAYFYEELDANTKRKAYLIKGQKIKYWDAREGDFNMAFFINDQGKHTTGWMLKADMKKLQ